MNEVAPSPPRLMEVGRRSPAWPSAIAWVAGGLAALATLVVLWKQEPAGQVYYPRCWLHVATGLQCPGCGVLRSTHALLNGRWEAAWRLNPLWVSLLPLMAWGWVAAGLRGAGVRAWQPWSRPWVLAAVAGLMVAYGVARNLPGLANFP